MLSYIGNGSAANVSRELGRIHAKAQILREVPGKDVHRRRQRCESSPDISSLMQKVQEHRSTDGATAA